MFIVKSRGGQNTRPDSIRPDSKKYGFRSIRVVIETWTGEKLQTRLGCDRVG